MKMVLFYRNGCAIFYVKQRSHKENKFIPLDWEVLRKLTNGVSFQGIVTKVFHGGFQALTGVVPCSHYSRRNIILCAFTM